MTGSCFEVDSGEVRCTPRDARLPEKADLILLVDVYYHIEDRKRRILAEARTRFPAVARVMATFKTPSR